MSGAGPPPGDRRARRRRAVLGLLNRTTLHPWTTDRDELADALVDLMERLDREEAAVPAAGGSGAR